MFNPWPRFIFFQTNYREVAGVLPSLCWVPQPQATQRRRAEQLRELSILFNDVLLGTSGWDADSLHTIYYTFRAVSSRIYPELSHWSNSEILLASCSRGLLKSMHVTITASVIWQYTRNPRVIVEQRVECTEHKEVPGSELKKLDVKRAFS